MTTSLPLTDAGLADRLTDRLALVEQRLLEAASHADHLADATSRHLVSAGGKRLRPLLTLLTAELGDGSDPRVLDAAVVVELTHLATLYHDDVMDSAPVRRGAPAAQEVWGNQVAILTGDLLLAKASALTARLGPDAVLIQAETFERLCLGQLHETVGPTDGADPVDHYLQVLADKTGSLIATSARYGALFAGCDQEVIETVTTYGEKIGLAFQLADDVIDLTDDGSLTGKRPGTDLREHVPTMPALLLRRLVASGRRHRRRPAGPGPAGRRPVRRRRPGRRGPGAARAPGHRAHQGGLGGARHGGRRGARGPAGRARCATPSRCSPGPSWNGPPDRRAERDDPDAAGRNSSPLGASGRARMRR